MTTIKEHIEAGHYPKTEDGMEIVQTSEGLTVHVADVHPDGRIAGWLSKGDPSAYTWNARGGAFQEHGGDLLPPPPRKVVVERWHGLDANGNTANWWGNEPRRDVWAGTRIVRVVKLTGEYEDPF
jgi:hypothetical protein